MKRFAILAAVVLVVLGAVGVYAYGDFQDYVETPRICDFDENASVDAYNPNGFAVDAHLHWIGTNMRYADHEFTIPAYSMVRRANTCIDCNLEEVQLDDEYYYSPQATLDLSLYANTCSGNK